MRHVEERLWKVARVLYGPEPAQVEHGVEAQRER